MKALNKEKEITSDEEVSLEDMTSKDEGYITESKEHDYESIIESCSSKEDLQNIISMAQSKLKEIE